MAFHTRRKRDTATESRRPSELIQHGIYYILASSLSTSFSFDIFCYRYSSWVTHVVMAAATARVRSPFLPPYVSMVRNRSLFSSSSGIITLILPISTTIIPLFYYYKFRRAGALDRVPISKSLYAKHLSYVRYRFFPPDICLFSYVIMCLLSYKGIDLNIYVVKTYYSQCSYARILGLKFRPKPKLGVLATKEVPRQGNAPNPSNGGTLASLARVLRSSEHGIERFC